MIVLYPPPISHWSKTEYVRTPVFIDDNNYIVSVGDNEIRIFTEDVPDFIKSLMTMTHAFEPKLFHRYLEGRGIVTNEFEEFINIRNRNPVFNHQWSIYDNNQDKRLDEVGWQLTSNLYMIVLTPDQFKHVKYGNSREQDQRQGQASTS